MSSPSNPPQRLIDVWPVLVAAGLAIAYGAVTVSFATISIATQFKNWAQMNAATLLFGADLIIGATAVVAGFALLLRREWARRTLVEGAIAIALYEFGRRFGSLAANPTDWRGETITLYVVMILAIALIRPMAKSAAAVGYTALFSELRGKTTSS